MEVEYVGFPSAGRSEPSATNQIIVIALNLLAFILNVPLIALGVGLVMALGTIFGKPGFYPIYTGILKPLKWVKPEAILDNPEPHRFAQGLGMGSCSAARPPSWLASLYSAGSWFGS